MALFFGKIKPGGEPSGQLENAFYFSPDGDQRFNGILPGDHSYIISGRLIQLWQAERWEQVEGGKRLCFRKVIEDIGLRVGGFMALRFFKVTNQLTVFSVRSSRRKAFFPIELAEPFPAEVMNDPATYRNPENFRRIAYFPVAPESESSIHIKVFNQDGRLAIMNDSFVEKYIQQTFADNRSKIGMGQPRKDRTLSCFKNLAAAKSFPHSEMSILDLYDAFCCTYHVASLEPESEDAPDAELDVDQDVEQSIAEDMQVLVNLLNLKKQIILQGSAGVGKTWTTRELALRVLGETQLADRSVLNTKYQAALAGDQIAFCTFHQSMDYENFVEGYKPVPGTSGAPSFELRPGIFKTMCKLCRDDPARAPRVLIIDEINRGNVSRIFGELITLLETDKREGTPGCPGETVSARLTYSKDLFTIPHNLYLIGTMNTTDRSLGQIDYALRRRFAFFTLKANRKALLGYYGEGDVALKDKALEAFDAVEQFLSGKDRLHRDLDIDDVMIGHSYFMAATRAELTSKFQYELIPILEEYRKDGVLTCDPASFREFLARIGN